MYDGGGTTRPALARTGTSLAELVRYCAVGCSHVVKFRQEVASVAVGRDNDVAGSDHPAWTAIDSDGVVSVVADRGYWCPREELDVTRFGFEAATHKGSHPAVGMPAASWYDVKMDSVLDARNLEALAHYSML